MLVEITIFQAQPPPPPPSLSCLLLKETSKKNDEGIINQQMKGNVYIMSPILLCFNLDPLILTSCIFSALFSGHKLK